MVNKALFFTQPLNVIVKEEEISQPSSSQVLIKTILTAISAGSELLIYRGLFPGELPLDSEIDSLCKPMAYPLKYGYSSVGLIEKIGDAVSKELLGRRVFSFHPHESFFNVDLSRLLFIPEHLSVEDAVLFANLETAVSLAMDGSPAAGERVCIIGQGIVGLLLTSILKDYPLDELTVLDKLPERRDAALKMGAGKSLHPDEALSLDGRFDIIFELSGDPEGLNIAVEAAGFEGRIIAASWYGSKTGNVRLGGRFHRLRQKIISSQVSSIAPSFSGRWDKKRRYDFVWKMMNKIKPSRLITHRFPIEKGPEVFDKLHRSSGGIIQAVFEY